MKILFLELKMGAAGDMLTAALLELLPETERNEFVHSLNHIGLSGVEVSAETVNRCGLSGTHMRVHIHGKEEEHEHHHAHEHHHGHEHADTHHTHGEPLHADHHHSGLHDIEHIVSHLLVSDRVKSDVMNVYRIIAEAESNAHGKPVTEIHFHEVGTMDAIADITAVCMLIERLSPERIIASPISVGSGTVHCAHGILPVPAPATAYILQGIPTQSGFVETELCTPTGAALLKYFVDDYSNAPLMKYLSIGYGMGTKDFHEVPNTLRATLGEVISLQKCSETNDSVIVLSCNVDDMTGEEAGFALDMIFSSGAREAFFEPVFGKKSRPGFKLTVITDSDNKDTVLSAIFKHTSTIGIRESKENRYVLARRIETLDTKFGPVRKKFSEGYGVKKEKWEQEDVSKIAKERGLSLREVLDILDSSV